MELKIVKKGDRMELSDFRGRNQGRSRGNEKIAEKCWSSRNIRYVRYGLDCLDSGYPIWKIPSFVRSAPDYIVFNNQDNPCFVEVKGFESCVRLKEEDLKSYKEWNECLKIMLFLYNINDKSYCEIMLDTILNHIESGTTGKGNYKDKDKNGEPNLKPYHVIPPKFLRYKSIDR